MFALRPCAVPLSHSCRCRHRKMQEHIMLQHNSPARRVCVCVIAYRAHLSACAESCSRAGHACGTLDTDTGTVCVSAVCVRCASLMCAHTVAHALHMRCTLQKGVHERPLTHTHTHQMFITLDMLWWVTRSNDGGGGPSGRSVRRGFRVGVFLSRAAATGARTPSLAVRKCVRVCTDCVRLGGYYARTMRRTLAASLCLRSHTQSILYSMILHVLIT